MEPDSSSSLPLGLRSLEGELNPVFVPSGSGPLVCELEARADQDAQLTLRCGRRTHGLLLDLGVGRETKGADGEVPIIIAL